MPSITISKNLSDINIIDLLTETNLVSLKSKARRLIEQNSISLNQKRVKSTEQLIIVNDLNNK